jgi:hypothetical protein
MISRFRHVESRCMRRPNAVLLNMSNFRTTDLNHSLKRAILWTAQFDQISFARFHWRRCMRTNLVTISLLVILISCASKLSAQQPLGGEEPTKTDLREAIFRYMFIQYNYGASVKVLCIAPERPLPDSFILRFSNVKPRVVWSFNCDNSGPMNGVREKKTGARGMRMSIISVRLLDGHHGEAKVEAFSDGIASNRNALQVIFSEGHWSVVQDKTEGVS